MMMDWFRYIYGYYWSYGSWIPSGYVFGYEYLSTYLVWRLNRRGRAGGPKLKAFRLVDHSSHRFIMTAWCRTMSEVS
jgi:hypothetical protein